MIPLFEILAEASFWAAALAIATPLVFGTLGALLCERAGILNLGIEGIFAAGALAGFLAVHLGADIGTAVMFALLTGAGIGFAHGLLTGPFGLSQPLTGIGITLLAAGLAAFAFTALFGPAPPKITALEPIYLPWISDLPFIGAALLQTPLTYVAIVLAFAVTYLFTRTPLGLAIRACGENPAAVTAQGRSVHALRIGAVMAGSALMALGGASLSLAAGSFSAGMVNGRGFICLALTTLTGWRTSLILVVALLVGAIDAYQLRAQKELALAPQIFLMIPFVVLIISLALTRTSRRPRALLFGSATDNDRDRD
jgi:ABC-type uncharacterized transport system permease subunit